MNLGKISVRYARALFQLANEKGKLEQVSKDMKVIFFAIRENDEFKRFLTTPIVRDSMKKRIIQNIFNTIIDPLSMDFLNMVVANNRLTFLEGMTRQYVDLYKKHQGITEAVITTVFDVDDEIRARIQDFAKRISSDKILLNEVQDPEIIGGFILKIEDQMIDASVSTKLTNIHKALRK